MKKIKIVFEKNFLVCAELNDTKIAEEIYNNLPIESSTNLWGEEIYFKIPVKAKNELPTLDVNIGDIGYWPDGTSFCIFFGKTPLSKSENKPVPYSEITVIGKIIFDDEIIKKLKNIKPGSKVILQK